MTVCVEQQESKALSHPAQEVWWVPTGKDMADIKHKVYQWDLVAVYVGYAKDDQFSQLPVLPRLRAVLNGVYSRR